ncbi:MAG TPA: type VI secretion system tip protein TssI/VgrG [Gemmatimonadaceae bacterium]|nr:type VI secretion system tip protein TssI/VgrG [Gemmatimonadaceae bacterium]
MGEYTQVDRPMRISTPLGPEVLLLAGLAGHEGVSTPFSFHLELLSEQVDIAPDDLLRKPVTVTLMLPDGGERPIHGLVSRFAHTGRGNNQKLSSYEVDVVPWLWFLSLSSDCKIFQQMTVLDIVEKVFKDQGYSDFRMACIKSYPKREYCVQYRETHLDFVMRLLEEEGIFYFFEHSDDKHVLVLADDNSAVAPCPDLPTASMGADEDADDDVVTSLRQEHSVYVGKMALHDYDPLQPTFDLHSAMSGDGKGEVYDYPGNYVTKDDGERYARIRLEAQEAMHHLVRGGGTCRAFQSGYRFDLQHHYRGDANQAYLLVQAQHTATMSGYWGGDEGEFAYRNEFIAIPYSIPYHPLQTTEKPLVAGSQTALVVGKSGEEIWVDKYGRVKVQFYWDRVGGKDENSSCWVRVASSWAGKQWGAIRIPRIGQEVIVDFLEGDPDRPIITGRVYNADQMPPYTLPANQTQSGVKTRSTKTGGAENYNELRFEDKKGSEEILLHAEKDLTVEVENDETRTVDHDRTTTVKNNDTRTVSEGNDAATVSKGNQTLDITKGNQTVTLGEGNQTVDIKKGNQTVTLEMGNQSTTLKMGNLSTVLKMGNMTAKMDLGKSETEAMESIELKVGQNSIKIDQMGVTIKGMMVKVEGQIQTQIKGLMTQVNGDAMLQLKGGIAMIN